MTEFRHASSRCSARNLCQTLREGQFAIAIVGNQCAVQQNQPLTQAHQPRPAPALELLREIGAVTEEHATRVTFSLHEGVDVTAIAKAAGKLDELPGPTLQREHETHGVDALFAHAG